MKRYKLFQNISAMRIVTSLFIILVGVAGVEHGFFELLKDNEKIIESKIHISIPCQSIVKRYAIF